MVEQKKIFFATTAHSPIDDRIYFHQAQTLATYGYCVYIFSSALDHFSEQGQITAEGKALNSKSYLEKQRAFLEKMQAFDPSIIIASEPFPLLCAKKYARKAEKDTVIVYDVTEWYPSKKNLRSTMLALAPIKAIGLALLNLAAGCATDGFIFGEQSKMFPFSSLFFWKQQILQPYYPSKKYVHFKNKNFDPQKINLCYTGVFTEEKGVGNFIRAVDLFRTKNKKINSHITFIGSAPTQADQAYFSRLLKKYDVGVYSIKQPVSFEKFTEKLETVDICFDLRSNDFENTHCLPIKIFYYAACGKPVVYSNLKALKKAVPVHEFGFLANPADCEGIAKMIQSYVDNPDQYGIHAEKARNLYTERFNWELLESDFCNFIDKL